MTESANPYGEALDLLDGLVGTVTSDFEAARAQESMKHEPLMMPTAVIPISAWSQSAAEISPLPSPASRKQAGLDNVIHKAAGPPAEGWRRHAQRIVEDASSTIRTSTSSVTPKVSHLPVGAPPIHSSCSEEDEDEEMHQTVAQAMAECLEEAEDEEALVRDLEAQLQRRGQTLAAAKAAAELAEARQQMHLSGSLDCSQALKHSLAVGGPTLLERSDQCAAETAQRVGILGEREDPADALWAEILCQQAICISELLFESRSLHAQADLRMRLAQCTSGSAAEKSNLYELRSLTAIQKALIQQLVGWTNAPHGMDNAADGYLTTASSLEWRRCEVEEALGNFRANAPHAQLLDMLESRLGRAVEVRNIPAILGELLEHDVAAAAEVLLVECARLELDISLRKATGSLASGGESRVAELRRAGLVCCNLAEEVEALRQERQSVQRTC